MKVTTTHVLKYTPEEYELLKIELINIDALQSQEHHSGKPTGNKIGLLYFIEYVLTKHDYSQDEEIKCWLNLSCKKLLYSAPLNRMPLLINSTKKTTRLIAKWRLKINK
jgi:hypothetical protein